MSAIDIHTHAFPDNIAARAMEKLQAMTDWRAVGDGTVGGLLESMDRADVDISAICAVATKPGQVRGILKWQKKIIKEHAHRLVPLCSVHPHDKNPENWIQRIVGEGVIGIKLHPMYQDFCIDDERIWCIYQSIAEHGLLLELHCGKDIGFPNDPIPDRASPQRIARVLRRFKGLRLLCTHMGGWQMWDQVETHLLGKDVYMETSFSLTHMAPERFRKMIQVHGAEKICFGSDWPWNEQSVELARIERLGLDKKTFRQLSMANAAQLLGL